MILVFLPAYNEEVALGRLVRKFDHEFRGNSDYKIVVLDDGSSDNTAQVARTLSKEYPLELLRHERNQGLGRTMIDGLRRCAEISSENDLVVTLDCDDTHEPKFILPAVQKMRSGYDVVVLSRFCPGGGQEGLSPLKGILSAGAGLFLKFFFPIRGVREYSCNFRVFSAAILKRAHEVFGKDFIRLGHLGFAVSPEILVKMRMIGARIAESPFVLRYDQKPTPSKNRPLRTIGGYFAIVWNYWGRRA